VGTLPGLGRFVLDMFDVNGRRVRTIAGDGGGATSMQVEWDGRDESGRRVASGRYWVRARRQPEADASAPAVPVILLR
jgi:flagellar hook assembly protein FlgD